MKPSAPASRPQPDPVPEDRPAGTSLVLAALVMLAFAAYGTTALDYRFFADDAVLAKGYHDAQEAFTWAGEGAWRFLGNQLMTFAVALAPRSYLLLTVGVHGFNVFLAWSLMRRFQAHPATAALAAGLLAVFPGYHEAMSWLSATHNVWSTTFFLLAFGACLRAGAMTGSPVRLTLAGFVCALVGDFFHDQYALAYFAMPLAVAWLQGERWRLPLDRRVPVLLAPAVGSGIYIVAYLLTLRTTTTHQPTLNWTTLFSPFAYQYLNFAALDVWQHKIWVHAFLHRVASPAGIGALALLFSGGALLLRSIRPGPADPEPGSGRTLAAPVLAGWATLLLGCSSVYAIAGGYSLESRKRYAIVFVGTIALAHLLNRRAPGRWLRAAAAGGILLLAVTTVAVTEARNDMLGAKDQLCRAIAAGRVPPGTYIVEWDTGPARFVNYLWNDVWAEVWFGYMWKDIWATPGDEASAERRRVLARRAEDARHLANYDWTLREWHITPLAAAPNRP